MSLGMIKVIKVALSSLPYVLWYENQSASNYS